MAINDKEKYLEEARNRYNTMVASENVPTYYNPSTIVADNLKESPTINAKTATNVSIYPVNGLNTDTTQVDFTQPEKEASSLSKMIQDLNIQTLGKSDYISQKETEYGINDLVNTQNDLVSQLKNIQKEDTALQNEYANIESKMQLQSAGRGITTGGLAPLTADEQRKVNLKRADLASRALTTSALLESAKGNLSTAQTLVEKAVAQKYDPITEQIDVLSSNLKLILESPEYTIAEKNRAQAQLDIQNAKKAQIEEEKKKENDILSIASEAAKNKADAYTLQKIQNAKDALEASRIYGLFTSGYKLLKPSELYKYTESQIYRDNNGDIYAKPSGMSMVDPTVQAYVNQIKTGKIKLVNVPANIRDKVAVALNTTNTPITNISKINKTSVEIPKKEQNKIQSIFEGELKKLAKGGDWGSSWNYIRNLYPISEYPDLTNEDIDEYLKKEQYYPR